MLGTALMTEEQGIKKIRDLLFEFVFSLFFFFNDDSTEIRNQRKLCDNTKAQNTYKIMYEIYCCRVNIYVYLILFY